MPHYYYQHKNGSFPYHSDTARFRDDLDAGNIVSVWCEKHGWYSPTPFGCMGCAHEEPEPGPDWVTDEPPWGQEDTSPETAEKRKRDWDRYGDYFDLDPD